MIIKFPVSGWNSWSFSPVDVAETDRETGSEKMELPQIDGLTPMQRRRLTPLSKIAFHVLDGLDESHQLQTVFASQHGDVEQTLSMLSLIKEEGAPSPKKFSQSVHNYTSGVYGITFGNRKASTAIAAGEDTLLAALIEAKTQLTPEQDVLVVYADVPLPSCFSSQSLLGNRAIGVALRLSTHAKHWLQVEDCHNSVGLAESLPFVVSGLLSKPLQSVVVQGEVTPRKWSFHSDG